MPPKLWEAAVRLCRTHGVSRVSRWLRLHHRRERGLSRVCRQRLEADPMSGAVFVFRNRRGRALKILVYDGQGFWLWQKQLSAGRFRCWPTAQRGGRTRRLEAHELQVLFACGDPEAARLRTCGAKLFNDNGRQSRLKNVRILSIGPKVLILS